MIDSHIGVETSWANVVNLTCAHFSQWKQGVYPSGLTQERLFSEIFTNFNIHIKTLAQSAPNILKIFS